MKISRLLAKLWEILGRVVAIIAWPGLYLLLNGTTRSRVVVIQSNKVMVVKEWLGDGKWSTPGGGLHKDEDEKLAVLRELKEETGIIADIKDLKPLLKFTAKNRGISNQLHCFNVELKSAPAIKTQKFEILRAEWKDVDELLAGNQLSEATRKILQKWKATSFVGQV